MLKELTAIGFTEYEAKVYLALLAENPANGYQVSKRSGVPRSMVYEALGRLEARGAVLKKEDRRATLYRPVPPDVLLDHYEKEHQRTLETLRTGLRSVYETQFEDDFWTISGAASVLSFAGQIIDSAKHELMLVLDDPEIETLGERLEAASDRGVHIHTLLIGTQTLECAEQSAHHPPLESEMHELTQTLVIVVDQKQVLIASKNTDMSAAITNNRNLVLIAHQFVWMELFTQRINAQLGPELLARLEPEDRKLLESLKV
jgi:HTH-type transcriptional regulator, sugar sensing transcriptional regulator